MCLDQSISPGQGEAFQFLVQKLPKDLTRVNKGPSKDIVKFLYYLWSFNDCFNLSLKLNA